MEILTSLNQFFGIISFFITLIIFFTTIIGFYWKLKLDIKSLRAKDKEFLTMFDNIKLDRKERWRSYAEDKKKFFSIYDNLNQCLSNVSGDIKEIKTNLEWLKNKNV